MHVHVRLALFSVLLACCATASCSSGSTRSTSTSTSTTQVAPSAQTQSTGFFGGAHSAACDTDLQMMETAVDAYLAFNGGTEATEAALVQQGLLREESVLHDIGPGATVIPSPTGGCLS
jgi:hypothetical protein